MIRWCWVHNTLRIVINNSYNQNVKAKIISSGLRLRQELPGGLTGGLKIAAYSFSSTILNVTFETPVLEKGRDILNRLFEIYNSDAIDDKNQIADKTLHFIDDRLELDNFPARQRRKEILPVIKSRESVVDLSTQASAYLDKVKDLDKQNSDIELKLDALNNLGDYVKAKGKKAAVPFLPFYYCPIPP